MSKIARDNRNREIGLIKMGVKALGMSDEDYRVMLRAQVGLSSARDLDHVQRRKVLDHLKVLGWKPTPKARPKRPAVPADKKKLVARIRAQLISLGNLPDTYADGIARHMFQVDRFEWCTHDQLHALTSALGYHQLRRGAEAA